MLEVIIWLACSAWIFSDLRLRVKKPVAVVSSLLITGFLGLLGNWTGDVLGFEKIDLVFSAVPMILGALGGREVSKSLRKRSGV
jgi:hypothetical protein